MFSKDNCGDIAFLWTGLPCLSTCYTPCFQSLETEVGDWQSKADSLKQLANKLISDYKEDDTSLINLQLEKLLNRWSTVLNK